MQLTNRQLSGLLYAVEGVGAIFVGLFISVYVAGLSQLPRDVVYHSYPAIRVPMSIIGTILIALILGALAIGLLIKQKS